MTRAGITLGLCALPLVASGEDVGDPTVAHAQALAARLNGDDKAVFAIWQRHIAARPERACEVASDLLQAGEIGPAAALACPEVSKRALLALRDWWASPLRAGNEKAYEARLAAWHDVTGLVLDLPQLASTGNVNENRSRSDCAPRATPLAAIEDALAARRATWAEYLATDYAATLQGKQRADALDGLASLFAQHGYARLALTFAHRAETFAPVRVRLARHYLEAGLASEALGTAPAGAIDIRVRALRALGRNQEARVAAEAAVQAAPVEAASHMALARTVIDEDPARAIAALDRAMRLEPTNDDAVILLARWLGTREFEVQLRTRAVSRAAQPKPAIGVNTGPARLLAGFYRDVGAIDEARRMACVAGSRPAAAPRTGQGAAR